MIPLLPYAVAMGRTPRGRLAAALTLTTLFAVGAVRGVITKRSWWATGLEVLALGALAGAAAFGAGAGIAWYLRGRSAG